MTAKTPAHALVGLNADTLSLSLERKRRPEQPCSGRAHLCGEQIPMVGEEPSDAALMERVADGDVAAMRAVYLRHSTAVQRFVAKRLRDQFEVSDIVHNAMLDVWRNAAKFEGRSNLRSWILTIARNKTVDHFRKQSRTELVEPDETIADDEAPNAEALIAASQDAARVRACVAKLGAQQRAAVHLAFFEDMTYAEIAEVENVPEGTIKTRIFHAKKLLMRCLTQS